ncbi:MAG: hypothetical protein GX622_06950 [Bacteroidales bacterium]|jgi:tetratricopeptide (TPR) repeat protein|nr:hypothetical protein [Bacteroidales bacterium]
MKLSSFIKYFNLRVINIRGGMMVVALTFILMFTAAPLVAQESPGKPSKAVAQAAWLRGDYETAYNQYSALLLIYSRDPVYQYYAGACLVKLERGTERAVNLLASAINSSVNIKNVPTDVWFYYGRALQMDGNFSQACDAYERFTRQAGRRISAEYETQKYIDQCDAGEGVVARSEPPPEEYPSHLADDPTANTAGKKSPAVRGDVTGIPGGKYRILGEAVELRREADSLAREAENKAREAVTAQSHDKERAEKDAIAAAAKADAKAAEADSMLLSAVTGRGATGERSAGVSGEKQTRADNRQAAGGSDKRASGASDRPPAGISEKPPAGGSDKQSAVAPTEEAPEVPAAEAATQQLSSFEIRSGLAYSDAKPVPLEPAMPEGLIYTIQIAAFRNDVSPSLFKGLYPVFGSRRQGSEVIYYYTGFFRTLDDARKALPEARRAGFPDAFIIAMMDGTRVSLERAAHLEKQWSGRPLTHHDAGAAAPAESPARPATAGTLSFRAEVMRSDKPLKPDVILKLEQLAGTRGLETIKNNDGETVFLIGKFITFESADEYVSLLIRNGYSSARVAAYVGMQEIPVGAARELINKLPDD